MSILMSAKKGDERFATVEEIKQQYKEIAESKKTFSGRGGIPVFRQENKLYIDDSIVNNLFYWYDSLW